MSKDLWITLPKSLIWFEVINLINVDNGLGLRSYILQTQNALRAIGRGAQHGKHAPTQIEGFLQPTRVKGRRAEAQGKQATMEVKNLRAENHPYYRVPAVMTCIGRRMVNKLLM